MIYLTKFKQTKILLAIQFMRKKNVSTSWMNNHATKVVLWVCVTSRGRIVVDYVICSLHSFNVGDVNQFIDHVTVTFILSACYKPTSVCDNHGSISTTCSAYKKYQWKPEHRESFINKLQSDALLEQFNNMCSLLDDNLYPSESFITYTVNRFSNLLCDAAEPDLIK